MKIITIGLTIFGTILVAANIVEAQQFSYYEDQYGKSTWSPESIAGWRLDAGSWCLYTNGGKNATTLLSYTLGGAKVGPIVASINSNCTPRPALINIPGGAIATNLTVERLESGVTCETNKIIFEKGFNIIRVPPNTQVCPLFYPTSGIPGCPPGYSYIDHGDGSVSINPPIPLKNLTLNPGTYGLWVNGGIDAVAEIAFRIGGQVVRKKAAVSSSCVPAPVSFMVPPGLTATGFTIDKLISGINCYTRTLIPEKGFCIGTVGGSFNDYDKVQTKSSCSKENETAIFDNWNTGACDTTSIIKFSLNRPAIINTVEIWYDVRKGGQNLSLNLSGPVSLNANAQIKACDPYQSQWCRGEAKIDTRLEAGQYTLTSSSAAICSNAASGGNGFIKIKGCSICEAGNNSRSPFDEDNCIVIKHMVPTYNPDVEPIEPGPGINLHPLPPR